MAMSDSTLAIVVHQHQRAVDRFHSRRQVEWQFAFSFWVLLGGLSIAIGDMRPRWASLVLAFSLSVGAVLFHTLFQVVYVHRQMRRDWRLAIALDRVLRKELDDSLQQVMGDPPDDSKYSVFWSHGWQVLITCVVAVIAIARAAL